MRNTRAFTLVELVLAMSITSLIGLAVAGAAMALSASYASSQEQYQNIQVARSVVRRLRSNIRTARLVTACNGSDIVVWTEDKNGDGKINITEIVLWQFLPHPGRIREKRIVFPDDWSPDQIETYDVVVPLSVASSVLNVQEYLKKLGSYSQVTVLANDISNLRLIASPAAPLTTYVGLDLTVGQGEYSIALRSAATLRKDEVDRVGIAGGQWVLMD